MNRRALVALLVALTVTSLAAAVAVGATTGDIRTEAGTGTAGFRVEWLRRRTIGEQAKDAHSLYLETAAELGLVGLALLGTALAGVAVAARRALRLAPESAAGPVAVVVLWAFHAGIDWDWEMPTVTLVGLAFAAALLALADGARS